MNEFNIEKYKLPPNQEDSDCLGIAIRQSKTNYQKKHIGFVFIDKDSKREQNFQACLTILPNSTEFSAKILQIFCPCNQI